MLRHGASLNYTESEKSFYDVYDLNKNVHLLYTASGQKGINQMSLSPVVPQPQPEEIFDTTTPHLDNTKRHSFVECRRKYYYQYVMNLKTHFGSTALRYGSTWHAGMEAFYQHIKDFGWTRDGGAFEKGVINMKKEWDEITEKETFYTDYRTLENCMQSFLQYMNHYAHDEGMLVVTDTEMPFKVNMECENELEEKLFPGLIPFHFTGKIDLEIELSGRRWIKEHKTTGQPLSTQVNRLNRSAQVMGYTYAKQRQGEVKGEQLDGALISVHHLSARKSTAKGNEGNYGAPKIEFERVPQLFSDNDIKQWRLTFLSVALDIQREKERNLYPMNHDACFNYGSCAYLGICEQCPSIDKIRFDDQKYYIGEAWEVAKDVQRSEVIF